MGISEGPRVNLFGASSAHVLHPSTPNTQTLTKALGAKSRRDSGDFDSPIFG